MKKNGAGASEPGPNQRAGKVRIVRPSTIMKVSRPRWNSDGQGRSGQGLCQHDWRPRCTGCNTRWEPVSTRRPSEHGEYDSVGDRERGEPSTPICETLAIAERRKTEETVGGGEELEAGADEVTGAGIRYEMADERGQDGKPESEEATTTKDEESRCET